ncbi:MAG TPA: hypothetical protein VM864_00115 [Pyrinomonadaceae bacterium]|nr:hypothetical protein [Pyrinomonadaceae bacterium]
MQLEQALLYDFDLAGRRLRLWKRRGESYEHVLMKALGFAMYAAEFPRLEVEPDAGLRYTPDLLARREGEDFSGRRFLFWGECGTTSLRKINWLLKHADLERLVLFKMAQSTSTLARELRASVELRYRAGGRLRVVSFAREVVKYAAERRVGRVPESWYTEIVV